MIENELKVKFDAHKRERVWPPESNVLIEMIEPGLGASKNPSKEQTALLGTALGWSRDGDEWYRSAASETVSTLIEECCAKGLTVAEAVSVIESAIGIGCEEYGG